VVRSPSVEHAFESPHKNGDLVVCLIGRWASTIKSSKQCHSLSLWSHPEMKDYFPGSLRWNISLTNDKFAKTGNFPTKPINSIFNQFFPKRVFPKYHSLNFPVNFSKINKKTDKNRRIFTIPKVSRFSMPTNILDGKIFHVANLHFEFHFECCNHSITIPIDSIKLVLTALP